MATDVDYGGFGSPILDSFRAPSLAVTIKSDSFQVRDGMDLYRGYPSPISRDFPSVLKKFHRFLERFENLRAAPIAADENPFCGLVGRSSLHRTEIAGILTESSFAFYTRHPLNQFENVISDFVLRDPEQAADALIRVTPGEICELPRWPMAKHRAITLIRENLGRNKT